MPTGIKNEAEANWNHVETFAVDMTKITWTPNITEFAATCRERLICAWKAMGQK
jgi:hypothetical protein